jgi:hypothetical protein
MSEGGLARSAESTRIPFSLHAGHTTYIHELRTKILGTNLDT